MAGFRPGVRRWLHAAAALLIFTLMHLVAGDRGFFSADEVVVHEQVERLADGAWVVEWADPVLEEDPARHPLEGVLRSEAGYAPYAKHPLFPLLLVPGESLFGRMGRFATIAVFAVAGAAAIASVAARRGASWPATFWLVALGTTMPFHAGVLWAHAPAFAAVALAMFPLERAASGGALRRRDVVLLVAAVVASGWLRSEAAIFFVVLGLVGGAVGLAQRRFGLAVLGAVAATASVLAFRIEGLVRAAIVGPSGDGTLSVPSTPTFDLGVRRFLFELWVFGFNGQVVSLLPFVAVVLLAIESRRVMAGASARLAILIVSLGCMAFGVVNGPNMSVVATVPLLVVGVVAASSKIRTDPFAQVVLGGGALFFAGVLMTSYASAGGGDWGGRYLFLVVAPMALLASSGLHDAWARDRRLPAAAVAAAACVAMAMMVDVVSHRQDVAALADDLVVDIDEARSSLGIDEPSEIDAAITIATDPRISRLLVEEGVGGAVYLARDEAALRSLMSAIAPVGSDAVRCAAYVDVLRPLEVDVSASATFGDVRVVAVDGADFASLEQAFCSGGR